MVDVWSSTDCTHELHLVKFLSVERSTFYLQYIMYLLFRPLLYKNYIHGIFQVRSLTLDVRVWEASVINLFQSLGNAFANSIWEELLRRSSVVKRNPDDVSR